MKNMTVGQRVGTAFAVVISCVAALSIGVVAVMNSVSGRMAHVSQDYLPVSQKAAELERALLSARIEYVYFLTIQRPGALERGNSHIDAAKRGLSELKVELRKSLASTELSSIAERMEDQMRQYEQRRQQVASTIGTAAWTLERQQQLTNEWAETGTQLAALAAQIKREADELTEQAALQSVESLKRTSRNSVLFALLTVLIALAVSRKVSLDVGRILKRSAEQLASGAEQVSAAASQVASASQSLAQGTSSQAASIEETSASVVEISSMAQRNSELAEEVSKAMASASEQAVASRKALGEMVDSMKAINAQSEKISKVIQVIEEIAFKTNILALNAAVEAARAGEAGMGFAVVADEVRNLAQRCSQSAQDTAALIEESISYSRLGSEKVEEVNAAVQKISTEVLRIRELIDDVSAGSQEQARGLEQIGKAVASMEQLSQASAASAEESAAAAEQLMAQSHQLEAVVKRLAMLVSRTHAQASEPSRALAIQPAS